MGGTYVALNSSDASSLQPLRDIDRERGATFATDWLAGLCAAEGVVMTPDMKAALWDGIQALASTPVAERTLTGLSLLIQSPVLKAALHPYTLDGPYGRLLDGDEETLEFSHFACFEMEELMHSPGAVAPVISYLFHRLEAKFDGRPTLLVLDEAWLYLDHPVFASRLRDWLKTLRKKNVSVVFATQSLTDIETSSISSTLIESCPTRIFLPNDRARAQGQSEIYRRFGLNDRQIDILAHAQPKQDYYYTSPLGARLFDLGLGPIALSVCASASPGDQALLERCLATSGAGGLVGDFLRLKELGWAADLLSAWPGPGETSSPHANAKPE